MKLEKKWLHNFKVFSLWDGYFHPVNMDQFLTNVNILFRQFIFAASSASFASVTFVGGKLAKFQNWSNFTTNISDW